MSYKYTDENTILILILWITGADGSNSFNEEKAIKHMLEFLGFGDDSAYKQLQSETGAMSTKNMDDLIGGAIEHAKKKFSADKKRLTYLALENIAISDGGPNRHENKRLKILLDLFEI